MAQKLWEKSVQVNKDIERFTVGRDREMDISLVGANLTRSRLNQIAFAIDDLLLPYQFDLSIFHKLTNMELVDHIRRVGISIFCKDCSQPPA